MRGRSLPTLHEACVIGHVVQARSEHEGQVIELDLDRLRVEGDHAKLSDNTH